MRPEITGDTANGRSMSVMSTVLPRKSNLAIAQAAAMPNTRFDGTEIAAVSSVSLMDDSASGSVNEAKNSPSPRRNASVNTAASGSTRKHARKSSATPVSVQRTHAGSRVDRDRPGGD